MPKRPAPTTDPSPVGERKKFSDAADYLKVSRATLQRLMYSGQIDYLKVGRHVQIETAELDRYLTTCRCGVGR